MKSPRLTKTGVLFFFLLLLFYFPQFAIFKDFSLSFLHFTNVAPLYGMSFLQAFLSALFTLIFSFLGALGIFWLKKNVPRKWHSFFDFLVLFPSLLPPLFVIVCFLNVFSGFPFGLLGIVLMHVFCEVGIVSLIIYHILQRQLNPYMQIAELSHSSSLFFLWKTRPLYQRDLCIIFGYLIVYFLMSLSVPLIMSGEPYSSLELSIYTQIVHFHHLAGALSFYFVQWLFVVSTLFFLQPKKKRITSALSFPSDFLAQSWGLFFVFFPTLILFCSLMARTPRGLSAFLNQSQLLQMVPHYAMGGLAVGFLTGGWIFLFLTVLSFFYQFFPLRKYFVLWVVASPVMVAFFWQQTPLFMSEWIFLKITLSIGFVLFPFLARFGLYQTIESLDPQIEEGKYWGGSPVFLFRKITFPQSLSTISLLSGLGGVWGVGDFAISKVISGRDLTLAMWMQSLVDQYRWDMALVLSWLLLFICFLVFFFFWSVANVANKKFK